MNLGASKNEFSRWKAREKYSWPFQVFQKHNKELSEMYMAQIASHAYIYKELGKTADWKDSITKHFLLEDEVIGYVFEDLKSWSNSYNSFDNWVNLNCIMAMSSNFETYLSTVIKLALESNPGVLFGATTKIDGAEILKYGKKELFNFDDRVISCTKGVWGSRVNAFEKIFESCPEILRDNISLLEKIRKLRNNVGHSFGRDIEMSRNHDVIDIVKMEKLTREKTIKYQKLIFGISKQIDNQLMSEHIGEYQALYFYHNLRPSLKHDDEIYERQIGNHAAVLKKSLGRYGATLAGKVFCRGLIKHYESL